MKKNVLWRIGIEIFDIKNKGTRYSQANIQDYMDDYLESQCKEFDDAKIQADKELFLI